ncbi:MAG: hypothetical protein MUC55_02540 [Burkholderiales bacterium]|jgi:hypothetical protein|nr:hypothetical protein [Burkholderiales bacterium]
MHDPVLVARLKALSNNLEVVSTNLKDSAWQPKQPRPDTRAELLEKSLWTGLETTVITAIRARQVELKKELAKLREAKAGDNQALTAAWKRYDQILRDSQSLLRECLEIIGTLAIRNKDLDQKILYVADELIRDCLTLTTGTLDYYLLVHGLGDTFSATRAHIIRLRFPEWTIWDLPLAAHELGHVVIALISAREKGGDEELRFLTPFIESQQQWLLTRDARLGALHASGGQDAVDAARWAAGRARALVADAFATFTMGPAYACAAIMLRLSPYVEASRDIPSDAERAHVVMSTLRWMNSAGSKAAKPYGAIIERLDTDWQNALERCNPGCKLAADEMKQLADLAEHFGSEVCLQTLNGTAQYPASSSTDGWLRALEWSGWWGKQLEEGKALSLPENPAGKLRDVLNATWLCRLNAADADIPDSAYRELAQAAQDLCGVIIAAPFARGLVPSTPATNIGGGK